MDSLELEILFIISLGGFIGGFFLFWISQAFETSIPPFYYDFSRISTSSPSPPSPPSAKQLSRTFTPISTTSGALNTDTYQSYPRGTEGALANENIAQKDNDNQPPFAKQTWHPIRKVLPLSPMPEDTYEPNHDDPIALNPHFSSNSHARLVASYRAAALSADPFGHGLLPPSSTSQKYFLSESVQTSSVWQCALFVVVTIVVWELVRTYLFRLMKSPCTCRASKITQSSEDENDKTPKKNKATVSEQHDTIYKSPSFEKHSSTEIPPLSPIATVTSTGAPINTSSESDHQSALSNLSFNTEAAKHDTLRNFFQCQTSCNIQEYPIKTDILDTIKTNDAASTRLVSTNATSIVPDITSNVIHLSTDLPSDKLPSIILDKKRDDRLVKHAQINGVDTVGLNKAFLDTSVPKTKPMPLNANQADTLPSPPNPRPSGSIIGKRKKSPTGTLKRDVFSSPLKLGDDSVGSNSKPTKASPIFPRVLPPFVVTRRRRPTKISNASENTRLLDTSPPSGFDSSFGSPPTPSPSPKTLRLHNTDSPSPLRTPTRLPFTPLQPPFQLMRNQSPSIQPTPFSPIELSPLYEPSLSDDCNSPPPPRREVPKFAIYTGDELSPIRETHEPCSPPAYPNTDENAIQRIKDFTRQKRLRRKEIVPLGQINNETSDQESSSPEISPTISHSSTSSESELSRPRCIRFADELTIHVFEADKADNETCMPTYWALSQVIKDGVDETTGEEIWRQLTEEEWVKTEELHHDISLEIEELRREWAEEGTIVWLKNPASFNAPIV